MRMSVSTRVDFLPSADFFEKLFVVSVSAFVAQSPDVGRLVFDVRMAKRIELLGESWIRSAAQGRRLAVLPL